MIHRRLTAIRSAMAEHRFQAMLVSEMTHVRYLTGFSGSSGLCVITPEKHFFITDKRYEIQAPQEIDGFNIIIAKQQLFPIVAEKKLIPKKGRIGFEDGYITVADMKNLKKLLPGRTFIPEKKIIEDITEIKDDAEIALIRYAVQITDKVFKKILKLIRPGIRECDIAAEISYWHRKYGAECDSFDPIVASGERGALPHARPSDKIIRRGEMVVLDFGCRYCGYNSDLTRTVAVGKPSVEMKKIYHIVLEAQRKAIDIVQNGIAAHTVDAAARKYIQLAGKGRYFIHSLGHGLGINVHESIRLSALSTTILKTGNVVTIEPGIYIPGLGGVRIEDDIVIQENGCDVLTTSAKELIIV
jgi:Xaa-Pro aminopeptidase